MSNFGVTISYRTSKKELKEGKKDCMFRVFQSLSDDQIIQKHEKHTIYFFIVQQWSNILYTFLSYNNGLRFVCLI